MFKTKNKKNKGITLIALVITILVLVILVGVVMSFVLGDDGIIGKAIKSKNEYEISAAKEQIDGMVAEYASQYHEKKYIEGSTTADTLADYIAENLENQQVGSYNLEKIGNRKYKLSRATDKKWTYGAGNTMVTDGLVSLKIGDYVNYNPTKGATQTSVTSSVSQNGYQDQTFRLSSLSIKNGVGWRVLGVDENGQLLLICDTTTEKLTLSGLAGYQNGVAELDKISSLYGQGKNATGARSVTLEDLNKINGETTGSYAGTNKLSNESVEYNLLYQQSLSPWAGRRTVENDFLGFWLGNATESGLNYVFEGNVNNDIALYAGRKRE